MKREVARQRDSHYPSHLWQFFSRKIGANETLLIVGSSRSRSKLLLATDGLRFPSMGS